MDPASLQTAIETTDKSGLTPRAVIPVDLFERPADYRRILPIAKQYRLHVPADAAQSFGASLNGKRTGRLGDATTTSFSPAKPLGYYGDGGAIFTDNDELADRLKSLRIHGQGRNKYDNVRIGMNGRLDTLQAAILLEKLAIFPDEIEARNRVAARYDDRLRNSVEVPKVIEGAMSIWAQYTLKVNKRDQIRAKASAQGVPTEIYYPMPLSQQTGYRHYPKAPDGVPVSESICQRVLSLPMHPYLSEPVQDSIIDVIAHQSVDYAGE